MVNEANVLHLLAHPWCYYFLVHSKYSQDVTIYFAQSWTALFRAFSCYRQPSVIPSCNFLLHNDDKQTQHVTIVFNDNQF